MVTISLISGIYLLSLIFFLFVARFTGDDRNTIVTMIKSFEERMNQAIRHDLDSEISLMSYRIEQLSADIKLLSEQPKKNLADKVEELELRLSDVEGTF